MAADYPNLEWKDPGGTGRQRGWPSCTRAYRWWGVSRLAYLLTGDGHQAEDLAQEAFVRCVGRFQHPPSVHLPGVRRLPGAGDVNLHTSTSGRRRTPVAPS